MTTTLAKPTRVQIEDFLFDEAALLDEWKLTEWLKLFRPDAHYLIPSLNEPDASPSDSLYFVMDDMKRLNSRINQYQGKSMWAENPLSRTRRIISNVRVLSADAKSVKITANFAIYRMRHELIDTYVGRYEHILVPAGDSFQFLERKAVLDLEALRPHGKISILL